MPNVLINPNAQAPLVGFAGNHLGDSIRVANVFNQSYIRPATGTVAPPFGPGIQGDIKVSGSAGALTAPTGWMYLTPIREPGRDSGATASLVVQQVNAGTALPIKGLGSGIINPAYRIAQVAGVAMIQLDCPRSILVAAVGTGGQATQACTIWISGADFWGQRMTATVSIAAGDVTTVYYDTNKCFKYISSMRSTGSLAPLWVGVGPTFGMDYFTPSAAFLNRVTYAVGGTTPTDVVISGGGSLYMNPPAITAAPSATANDVRGALRLDTTGGNSITNLAPLTVSYIINGSTAQVANTYDLASNQWAPTAESLRVANLFGGPQYYSAALTP